MAAEIKLRAQRRIGEISANLETAKANQSTAQIPTGGKKRDVLKAAGLSTSTAHRYVELA